MSKFCTIYAENLGTHSQVLGFFSLYKHLLKKTVMASNGFNACAILNNFITPVEL